MFPEHDLGVEPQAMVFILRCISAIRTARITVEMNIKVPDSVLEVLRPITFTITQHARPYDSSVFAYF